MLMPLMFAAAITIPVPGGLVALAEALGIDAPDRGRAVAEIVRVVYGYGRQRELLEYFAADHPRDARDTVPLPLPAEVWSSAVFHRRVTADELFVAVLSDRSAALLAYGFAALDDETLEFFAKHPALIARLYKRDAALVAAFAGVIHIHANRVVPPGGDAAVPAWEGVARAKVSNPQAFVSALMTQSRGRLAYLFEVFDHVDRATAAAVLQPNRLTELAQVVTGLFPEWDARKHPFSRPSHDVLAMFLRVRQPIVNPAAVARQLLSDGPGRAERLDQFAFGQRVFAEHERELPDAAFAIRAFARYPMLMLTLERIGVERPAIYAACARAAERASDLSGVRRRTALVHLQGAMALVDRMRRVKSIDRAAAETLLESLPALPAGQWLDVELRRALTVDTTQPLEEPLLRALAGAPHRLPARSVSWEGGDYVLDFAAVEYARIRQFRQSQGGPSLDVALDMARLAKSIDARAAERVVRLADTLLADALLSLVYAADWPGTGNGRVIRNAARRHYFGDNEATHDARVRMTWALPQRTSTGGVGWRLDGALLGLDVGLAPMALRRISAEALMTPPAVSSTERSTFVESYGMINTLSLTDRAQAALAEAITAGEHRVESLRDGSADVDVVVRAIRMDGHRARALRWSLANEREQVSSYFSMTELARLGGAAQRDLNAWGMSLRKLTGCLCVMASTAVPSAALVGRAHLGLLAAGVADLHLRVAVTLHELQLPAALTKPVLAAAAQEFLDRVKPSDADDWLTLARTAKALSRERVEDYLSGATLSGPLVTRR